MQELASSLMEGYQGYASEHPEADYSHLQEDFVSYINSTEAQEILRRHIQTIIADGGGVSITQEQIQELIQRIFKGYQAYLIKMGYTDPEQFDAYLAEYCRPKKLFRSQRLDFRGDAEQRQYRNYIRPAHCACDGAFQRLSRLREGERAWPDPTEMGQRFIAYLNTGGRPAAAEQRYHKNRRSQRTAVPGFFCAHKLHGRRYGKLLRFCRLGSADTDHFRDGTDDDADGLCNSVRDGARHDAGR